jgi:uncharacterized membrane protein YgdD (TMEM256/DUF423 family)
MTGSPRSARIFLFLGSVLGFLAVALGAFGAHGLRDRLPPDRLDIFEIAVRYQMYHALALLGVGWAASVFRSWAARAAGWLFVAGVLVFSGSLYVLALTGARFLGAVTPVGGLFFLLGWIALAFAALKGRTTGEA